MLSFWLSVVTMAGIYGIAAISLDMQGGAAGLLDFGQVAFFGFGAYATGIASWHGAPWELGVAAGMVIAAMAGAAVGRLGRTLRAEYWAIATLALAALVQLVALNADSLTNGAQGISNIGSLLPQLGIGVTHELGDAALVLALLGGCWWLYRRLQAVQFGRSLRLLREEPDLAAALGHDVVSAKVRVLAVSAPMAALAGSLAAHYISYIGPTQLLTAVTFLLWTMVIVGGLGNGLGVIVGAFTIQLLSEGTRFIKEVVAIPQATEASLRILLIGALLLAFLSLRPGGLIPERLRRQDRDGASLRGAFRLGAMLSRKPSGLDAARD